jgi:hypothetical protein
MIESNTSVRPDWGHALLTPFVDKSGRETSPREIRVPRDAFQHLRKMGVLERNRAQLKPIIYGLLDPNYDDLLRGIGRLIGRDLSGPAWLVCKCYECQAKFSDLDHTRLPGRSTLEQDEASRIVREVKARRLRQ